MPGALQKPHRRVQLASLIRVSDARLRFAAVLVCGGVLVFGLAGCHRSPSADVVATVNGKEILRAELERNYQISLGDNPQKPSPQEADIRRLNVLHTDDPG